MVVHVLRGALPSPSCRAAEKQALGSHRKAVFPECAVAPDLLGNAWQVSKEGRKQVRSDVRELEVVLVAGTEALRWPVSPQRTPPSAEAGSRALATPALSVRLAGAVPRVRRPGELGLPCVGARCSVRALCL